MTDGANGLKQSAQRVDMMLSVALGAHLSGRTVTVSADNVAGWGCRMGAIKIE